MTKDYLSALKNVSKLMFILLISLFLLKPAG
jgi:hypothetical protein